jgi:hypothetical protein
MSGVLGFDSRVAVAAFACAAALFLLAGTGSAGAATFTVDSTADSGGTCSPGGSCTLRQALNGSNAVAGADTIAFSIGGGGSQTIVVASTLPAATGTVAIDGSTQPGFSGSPLIRLRGSNDFVSAGIAIQADDSAVYGLDVVTSSAALNLVGSRGSIGAPGKGNSLRDVSSPTFTGAFVTGDDNVVRSNTISGGNRGLEVAGSRTVLGGRAAGERNSITGFRDVGARIRGNASIIRGNTFQGGQNGALDLIGSDSTIGGPQSGDPNSFDSFSEGAALNIRGDRNSAEGDSAGRTDGDGVFVAGNGNTLKSLHIGRLATFVFIAVTLNGNDNVLEDSTVDGFLGVQVRGDRNRILANTISNTSSGIGVDVLSGTRNPILSNLFPGPPLFSIGIILASSGTENDPGDADTGPNDLQNHPVLSQAFVEGGSTTVSGNLNSNPTREYRIQFYSSDSDPASCAGGRPGGSKLLGTSTVTTDASGNASFRVTLPEAAFSSGWVAATATDPDDNTSQFSHCVPVNRPPDCSTATANPSVITSNNHKFVPVTVEGVSDPDGDAVTVVVDGVTQDEPVNGAGDGNTTPDAEGGDAPDQVRLRAERSSQGDGRVYRISFTATDATGATCQGSVAVGVPKGGGGAIDSAPPSYDSFGG